MNILMLPSLYYPHIGGVEIAVKNLCRQFTARGHNVEIVTTRYPRSLPKHDVVDGIKVTRLPFVLPRLSGKSVITFPFRFLQCLIGLERVLRSARWDLVNLHYLCEPAFYAELCCRGRGIPIVASVHGSDIELAPRQDPLQKFLVRRCLIHAAATTTNSNSLAQSVCQLVGHNIETRLVVAGNGVSLENFVDLPMEASLLPTRRYLLGLGRMHHVKAFDLLIRAFATTAKQYPDVDLVLVGDGVDRPGLEQLSADCGLSNRVKFMGKLPNKDVPALLHRSEFLVIPSRQEGFGIAALEAMASRKAVVAMAVGGLKEVVVDQDTGLLVREQTPKALANAMTFLLSQPHLAAEFGRRGRKLVESRYSWNLVAERYIEVFKKALQTRPRSCAGRADGATIRPHDLSNA